MPLWKSQVTFRSRKDRQAWKSDTFVHTDVHCTQTHTHSPFPLELAALAVGLQLARKNGLYKMYKARPTPLSEQHTTTYTHHTHHTPHNHTCTVHTHYRCPSTHSHPLCFLGWFFSQKPSPPEQPHRNKYVRRSPQTEGKGTSSMGCGARQLIYRHKSTDHAKT